MATLLVVQHQSHVKLRQEHESLRQKIEQLSKQRQRILGPAPQASESQSVSVSEEQSRELLRLREEIARLRKSTNELAMRKTERTRTTAAANAPPDQSFAGTNNQIVQYEIAGIGLALSQLNVPNSMVFIQRVLPDSPAAAAGLWPGLDIRRVNGVRLAGRSLAECTELIRGPVGTIVELELSEPLRQEERFTVELTRQKIVVRPEPPE